MKTFGILVSFYNVSIGCRNIEGYFIAGKAMLPMAANVAGEFVLEKVLKRLGLVHSGSVR
jgi:hypothetical protein